MKTVFEQDGYTVKLNFIPVPTPNFYTEWIVSDGTISFSLGYQPTLTLDGVKEEVRKYKLEKEDDDSKHEQ